MRVIGLDTSLTHTGYTVLEDSGIVVASGVIKSKPQGKKPVDETRRIMKIVEDIKAVFDENVKEKPDMVIIEGLAFMARNSTALVQLAGLNYMLRAFLVENDYPFLIVAPTSLKKFITGSGRGDKDMMMMKVFKHYSFESMDNNECDAFSLAVCGLAALDKPLKPLLKPQEEVLKLLKTQIDE